MEGTAYDAALRADREQTILQHMPLVKRIAHGVAAAVPRHVDAADLVSAGMLGLIRAVDAFDPGRGTRFESFASQYVRGAVYDHLRAQDPLPYSTRVKVRRVERTAASLSQTLKRTPTPVEIAAEIGSTPEDVVDLLDTAARVPLYSIEELLERSDSLPEEIDESKLDPLGEVEQREVEALVMRWIEELPRNERLVLALYYHEQLKMKEIGAVLGVTESRVSQIRTAAVAALRARLCVTLGFGDDS